MILILSILNKDILFFEKYPFSVICITFVYYYISLLKLHATPCQYLFRVVYININPKVDKHIFSRVILDMCLAKNLPVILISFLHVCNDMFNQLASIFSYFPILIIFSINIFIIWSYTVALRDTKTWATFYDKIFKVRLIELIDVKQ